MATPSPESRNPIMGLLRMLGIAPPPAVPAPAPEAREPEPEPAPAPPPAEPEAAPPPQRGPGPGRVDSYIVGLFDAQMGGWMNAEAGELAPGYPVDAEHVVIDVGCGDGGITAFCARRGAHIIMADVDAERLAGAAERLRALPARKVETHVTDAHPLPLADAVADRVVCTEVLEHVDEPPSLLAELVRVGRPGALYLITVPSAESERVQKVLGYPEHFRKPNHIHVFEAEEFRRLVEDAGLVIERESADGFFWSIWFAFFRQTGIQLGEYHPLLDSWADTWLKVLRGRDGPKIKMALDRVLPKRRILVARKPG